MDMNEWLEKNSKYIIGMADGETDIRVKVEETNSTKEPIEEEPKKN